MTTLRTTTFVIWLYHYNLLPLQPNYNTMTNKEEQVIAAVAKSFNQFNYSVEDNNNNTCNIAVEDNNTNDFINDWCIITK